MLFGKTPRLFIVIGVCFVTASASGSTTAWLQFQGSEGHPGEAWLHDRSAAGLIDTPDEQKQEPHCHSVSSPAAWQEETPLGTLQFVVTTTLDCAMPQPPLPVLPGGVVIDYGLGTWDSLSSANRLVLRSGPNDEDMSASPAVFYKDDQGLDTTAIVTTSDDGILNIHGLGVVGGQLVGSLEMSTDIYVDFAGSTQPIRRPQVSPLVLEAPDWRPSAHTDPGSAYGPWPTAIYDHDLDGDADDYVYVVREEVVDPDGVPGNGDETHKVWVESYDLHDYLGNPNPPASPIYESAVLPMRTLTLSTPAILLNNADSYVGLPTGTALPRGIEAYKWKLNPFDPTGEPPSADVPPHVSPPPSWPWGNPWQPVPSNKGVYLFVCTADDFVTPPQGTFKRHTLSAFDINPFNMVNGKYPLVWEAPQITDECNAPITAVESMWLDTQNGAVQVPAVILNTDGSGLKIYHDVFSLNWDFFYGPGCCWWGRASATYSAGLIMTPYAASTGWPFTPMGWYELAWYRPGQPGPNNNGVIQFFNYDLSFDTTNSRPYIPHPSGVATQALEDTTRFFYIGVKNPNAPGGFPLSGVLSIDFQSILGNNPANANYAQVNIPATQGWIYSTPAVVSDGTVPRNYLFASMDGWCGGCTIPPQRAVLLSWHS